MRNVAFLKERLQGNGTKVATTCTIRNHGIIKRHFQTLLLTKLPIYHILPGDFPMRHAFQCCI